MSIKYLHQIPLIHEGLSYLLTNDSVFSAWGLTPGDFEREYIGAGFSGLVRIVIGQQVSVQAASSLWRRFQEGVTEVSPRFVLTQTPEDLRALGLSRQKARYILDLAEVIETKCFDPLALESLSDEEVSAAVMALKGFGAWSAEIFLMFCLARPDVWPAGDLGIQEGLRRYLGQAQRPDFDMTLREGERFAPYRTAASLLLWHLKAMG